MSDNKDILDDIINDGENTETGDAPSFEAEEIISEEPAAPEADAFPDTAEASPIEAAEEIEPPAQEDIQPEEPQYAPRREQDYRRQYAPQYDMYGEGPMIRPAPKKKKKKKKKKRRASRLPGVLILVTLIFGISIISSLVIISFGKDMLGIGKSEETHVFIVPEGATTQDVADMLFSKNIIMSAKAFKLFADFSNPEMVYVTGEHFIRPNMPYETLIDELTKVPTEEMGESVEITFPEGIDLIQAAYLLEEENICDAEEFIFYFNAGGFGVDFENKVPKNSNLKFQRMEGYLFPDTYFFYQNSKPEEVCQKIYYNFDTKMNSEYVKGKKTYANRYERMEELGLSLDELITLASIVQMEAANTDDMVGVASVFWNRLEHPEDFKKLESDPTQNYATKVIRPNMQYLDQTIVDAYDTYKSNGLPPGAIGNPGLDAIDAVLEKKKSKNYYFIANIHTKETRFAETLEQHEANAAAIEQEYLEEQYENEE